MPKSLTHRQHIILYFAVACFAYVVFMNLICMLLRPQLFDHPHWGISYFGSHANTVLPYYGGSVLMIMSLIGITRNLADLPKTWQPLRGIFSLVIALAVGIAATSYMQGPFLFWAHIIICLVLLLVVLCAEVWILTRPGTKWFEFLWAGLLLLSAVLLNLSSDWANVLGIYAWSELLLFVAVLLALGTAAIRAIDATSD